MQIFHKVARCADNWIYKNKIMSTLLIHNAELLVTMDDHRREIPDGGLFVRDGFIEKVGPTSELPGNADEELNLKGHILLPGLVNTHHHFYQTLTRAIPAAQNANLFNWLKTLYPIWARMKPQDIQTSTQTALLNWHYPAARQPRTTCTSSRTEPDWMTRL
jgi:8-oxoguanine deaminase